MKKQIKETKEELTHPIQLFIKNNCENVSKMDLQLTYEQALKLEEKHNIKLIESKILAMENLKVLTKKYRSVYLTLNHWCQNF